MRRIVCALFLAAFAAGCGTSRGSDETLNNQRFLPFGRNDISAQKRTFEATVKKDPNNKFGWYNLGVIAEYEHDVDTAAADFAQAIRIDPHMESALYSSGVLRYNAADYRGAATYLRRAVAENGRDANALWYLGLALRMPHTQVTDRDATRYLNAALKLDPALADTLTARSGSGGSDGSGPG